MKIRSPKGRLVITAKGGRPVAASVRAMVAIRISRLCAAGLKRARKAKNTSVENMSMSAMGMT